MNLSGSTDCVTAKRNPIHSRAHHLSLRPEEYYVIEMAPCGSPRGITGLSTSTKEQQMYFRLPTASQATMTRIFLRITRRTYGYLLLKDSTDFVITLSLHFQESKV